MEVEEDEFGELYLNFNTKNAKNSSENDLISDEPKLENKAAQFEIDGRFVENEVEMEIKDVNFTIMPHLNNGKKKSENMGLEKNEEGKRVGDESFVDNKGIVSELENCDSQNNFVLNADFKKKSGPDNLESHPMVLELMSSTDICDEGEDEVKLRVIKIANDCGIGLKQDENSDGESDSENGLNLIFPDDDNGGVSNSGFSGNFKALPTSYDDDSYGLEDNWTGLGAWCEEVLCTRLDFVLPSHQTIFDINIDNLKEKRWRRPGVNLTDYFNFGLNEQEWKNYCKKMAETCCTKMDATNEKSQDKVAGETYAQSTIPTGEAIQVRIDVAERFPSIGTETPRSSQSDTVIEIIMHDDNSDKNDNSEYEEIKSVSEISRICSFQYFNNVDVDVIQPFPLDGAYLFFPVYEQWAYPPEERKGKKDKVEKWPSTRPGNLSPISENPILTNSGRNDLKDESWRDHISDLIHKYGKDICDDDRKRENEVYTKSKLRNQMEVSRIKRYETTEGSRIREATERSRIKRRYEATKGCRIKRTIKGSRIKKGYETTIGSRIKKYETFASRRCVWERESHMPNKVRFSENKNKRLRSEENCRKEKSAKRFNIDDLENDREEGEIISIQGRVSKNKSVDCRSNYCQQKVIKERSCRNPRKRPFLRPSY